jgi:hypothetical protein
MRKALLMVLVIVGGVGAASSLSSSRAEARAPVVVVHPIRRAVEPERAPAPPPREVATTENDDARAIESIEAASAASQWEKLPELARIDLAREPELAGPTILAVSAIGAGAPPAERAMAARMLERWLAEESRRDTPDGAGNTSLLIDALADVGDDRAMGALVRALDSERLPLHVETLLVQRIGADPSARAAVTRFLGRVESLPPTEGLDEELRTEALDAARAALSGGGRPRSDRGMP